MKHHSMLNIILLLLAAPLAARERLSIVVSMVEPQRKFFEDSIVAPFAAANSISVAVVNTPDIDGIVDLATKTPDAGLFMVPFGKAWEAVDANRVRSLNSFLSKRDRDSLTREYILTWLGRRDDEQYFLPDKYETRIMAYRKSKVAEAVKRWKRDEHDGGLLRDSIAGLLRKVNGQGLPDGYALEAEPDRWDFFDVFVIGAIWAGAPGSGNVGRLGHRTKQYSGTALRIIDRVVQCGGDSAAVLSMRGNPVTDAFMWESMYAAFGLCNREMFRKQWSGRDLWQEFAKESIYLSFLTQVDCFFVHGAGDAAQPGYLSQPDDLGFSTMPSGCSVELDVNNQLKRIGTKAVTTGGWWWAIPQKWHDPGVSYRLFRHITSTENQLRECTKFGMIPVRNDVLKNEIVLSGMGWISDVFRVSYEQIRINNEIVVPASGVFGRISELYLDAWNTLVCSRNQSAKLFIPPDRKSIETTIIATYAPQAMRMVRSSKK